MAHSNANRQGRTGGEDKRSPLPRTSKRAAKQAPTSGGGSAAGVAARRRPLCGADGEPASGLDDGGGQPRRADTRVGTLDLQALDILIVQQWTKTLRGPYDWGDWPLARYTLGAGVLRMAQPASASVRCASPAATRVAWVCAMVACGRAARLRSLDPRPLLGAGDEQLVRPDGACGWRCNLERDVPGGPQLYYWIHPSGLVEFETISSEEERCRA
jgi:hypothetical protein